MSIRKEEGYIREEQATQATANNLVLHNCYKAGMGAPALVAVTSVG
jgi:hypothetical protein